MKELVIAANRLPVEISADGLFGASPGGLASALSSVTAQGAQWVGWGGPASRRRKPFAYDGLRLVPVTLTADDVTRYYQGFSNSILWPLFHGRLRRVELNRSWWRSYRSVSERFAKSVIAVAPLGGTVWIHDYHLLLVPALIRSRRPDLRIGLFVHIPFPNVQLFSMLPWRDDVIAGMLGADVVGFQVGDDVTNFLAAAERFGGSQVDGNIVFDGTRETEVAAFPISIDFSYWDGLGQLAADWASANRRELNVDTIYLGIDRMDYTKGITQRLQAFGELLDEGRLLSEQAVFVQVAVPTRSDVVAYQDERAEVERLVAGINARHRRKDGTIPVLYIDSSLDDVQMAGWHRTADSLVVTSLADGMNLVAKEFVAARGDLGGTLILSEFTGAAQDLAGAVIVNPYDIEAIKSALLAAAAMAPSERQERMEQMRAGVQHHDVHRWARTFLDRLQAAVPSGGRRRALRVARSAVAKVIRTQSFRGRS